MDEQRPRDEIEDEAEERREARGGPDADDAGEAADAGLIGPDQPGGLDHPEPVTEGGPPNPPGPAAADPGLLPQDRDPSLVSPRIDRPERPNPARTTRIPVADMHPHEQERIAGTGEGPPPIPERDRPVLRPKKKNGD